MHDREKLEDLFKEAEKRGIEAHANFTCCNTCAVAEMKGDQYLYWHAQEDERAFDAEGNLTKEGVLVGWGTRYAAGILIDLAIHAGYGIVWEGEGRKVQVLPQAVA